MTKLCVTEILYMFVSICMCTHLQSLALFGLQYAPCSDNMLLMRDVACCACLYWQPTTNSLSSKYKLAYY